jgi:hypothetical protein
MKHNPRVKENIVLLVGILIFMFFYYVIKSKFESSLLFIVVAVSYLTTLKWLSKYLSSKSWEFPNQKSKDI